MKEICLALDSSLQSSSIIPCWDLAGFSMCCGGSLAVLAKLGMPVLYGGGTSECCPEELILKKCVVLWQDDKVFV